MNARFLTITAVFVAFTAYTIWAVLEVGYVGLLMNPTPTTVGNLPIGPLQIAIDLVIMAIIALGWLIGDAKRRGITPVPFVLITLFLGSIGPLLYLMVREFKSE